MATIVIIISALLLLVGIWPIGIPLLLIGIYLTIKKKQKSETEFNQYRQYKEAEAELHEIETDLRQHQEIEMIRKSNEILLHLIQDEHREEGR